MEGVAEVEEEEDEDELEVEVEAYRCDRLAVDRKVALLQRQRKEDMEDFMGTRQIEVMKIAWPREVEPRGNRVARRRKADWVIDGN